MQTSKKTIAKLALVSVSGILLMSGCSKVSSNLEIGASVTARHLECCMDTQEAIKHKVFEHVKRNTTFPSPDETTDFGLTWTVEGDGKGLDRGIHYLVLNYINTDKSDNKNVSTVLTARLPFVVLNPEVGQHTVSFIIDKPLDYSIDTNGGYSLLAPKELILNDIKRIQDNSGFLNGPKMAETHNLNGAISAEVGHTRIQSSGFNIVQHIVAFDNSGKRIIIEQPIKNDGYRYLKNNEDAFIVYEQGTAVMIPKAVGTEIPKSIVGEPVPAPVNPAPAK